MSYFQKILTNVKGFYNEINSATLTGSIDVIIIEQEDGTFTCSPFHVRFGKLGVLRSREKVVDIEINDQPVGLHMKLGYAGEAFFVKELDEATEVPAYLATSPIESSEDLMSEGVSKLLDEAKADDDGAYLLQKIKEMKSDSSHDETLAEKDETVGAGKTKRRKKKVKKKVLTKTVSRSQSATGLEHEEIFDMDVSTDADDEVDNTAGMTALSKSVSLPVMEEDRMDRTSDWASSQYETYLNTFSDTDITPLISPRATRPSTPKSDTEYENTKRQIINEPVISDEDRTEWKWGDLPKSPLPKSSGDPSTSEVADTVVKMPAEASKASTSSGGLFQFMKKTKSVRHKPEQKGIYLDDLNLDEMDPELVKLYFPQKRLGQFESIKEDDNESGRGASLPQSPHSVEGAIGGPSVSYLDSEVRHLGPVSLSLCGGLADFDGTPSAMLEKFMQKIVSFVDISENPSLLNNPDLVVRIHDKYYNWVTAVPIIICQVSFHQSLPEPTVQNLIKEHMPKKKKQGSSWFPWRRAAPEMSSLKTEPPVTSVSATAILETEDQTSKKSETSMSPPLSITSSPKKLPQRTEPLSPPPSITDSPKKHALKVEPLTSPAPSSNGSPKKQRAKVEPKLSDPCLKMEEVHARSETDVADSEPVQQLQRAYTLSGPLTFPGTKSKEKFKKVIRLTSEQISELNLQKGKNEITFSVTTQYQGTCRCSSDIYLWRYDDKIIISDIDGTITKSDVLGHIMPMLGRDWFQSGVAQLFTNINNNGYKIVYLSSRAIGQSRLTKDLLRGIKQGTLVMPDGPLLLSPTSLINALHREVIEKKPEEFKISCLRDISELFPKNRFPFYAGFGNKINDVCTYKTLNVPNSRIFTINHKGEVRYELSYMFKSSYSKLNEIADHFFPPIRMISRGLKPPIVESPMSAPYTAVSYWREPLPIISNSELFSLTSSLKESTTETK